MCSRLFQVLVLSVVAFDLGLQIGELLIQVIQLVIVSALRVVLLINQALLVSRLILRDLARLVDGRVDEAHRVVLQLIIIRLVSQSALVSLICLLDRIFISLCVASLFLGLIFILFYCGSLLQALKLFFALLFAFAFLLVHSRYWNDGIEVLPLLESRVIPL